MKSVFILSFIFIIIPAYSQIPETKAFNFSEFSSEGKIISLNDYKSNYILLDFWASWCRPCRKFNPKLLKLYHTFHPRGLQFIGVSLDVDTSKWRQAILQEIPGLYYSHVRIN